MTTHATKYYINKKILSKQNIIYKCTKSSAKLNTFYTYVCLFLLLFCSYYTAGRQARFTVTFVYKNSEICLWQKRSVPLKVRNSIRT